MTTPARNWPTRPVRKGQPYILHTSVRLAAEQREASAPPKVYGRSTSVIMCHFCETCRGWSPAGSHEAGRCLGCHTPYKSTASST